MTKKLKISLLVNSHTFVEEALKKAVLAETDTIQWKYAIFSIVQSIELILKERLRREHAIMIYTNIDKPKITIGLDLAIERLRNIANVVFSKNDLDSIETAKKWRNLITHYEFEFEPKELKVVFAKLLGFSVHFNKKEFDIDLDAKIRGNIWSEAISIIEYASELYDRAQQRIAEEEIDGEFVLDCPHCSYDTFVIQDGIDCCYVCGFSENVIECPDCKEFHFETDCKEYHDSHGGFELYCYKCYERRTDEDDYYYHRMMEESEE